MTPNAAIIAIIPARYGSTRLPGKPLLDIGGKPLILHVCERAAKAALVSRVVVATDHASIIETVRKSGAEAVLTPSGLPSGTDRVAYVARTLPADSIIVNVQGDEPLILPDMIDAAVRPLIADPVLAAGTLPRGAHATTGEPYRKTRSPVRVLPRQQALSSHCACRRSR